MAKVVTNTKYNSYLEHFVFVHVFFWKYVTKGCSQIMSAAEGEGGLEMLTMADKGGRGGKASADNG